MKKPIKKQKHIFKMAKNKKVKTVKKPESKTKKIQTMIKNKKPKIMKNEPLIIDNNLQNNLQESDTLKKDEEIKTILSGSESIITEKQITQDQYKQLTYDKKHQAYAIFGVVFSILGFIIPLIAILGIIFGFLSEKYGSKFGKAIVLLGFVAFIVNMFIIFGTSFYDVIS